MKQRERDMPVGTVFRTVNGNLYVVLPNRMQAYLGNVDFSRSDTTAFLPERLDRTSEWDVVAQLPEEIWVEAHRPACEGVLTRDVVKSTFYYSKP